MTNSILILGESGQGKSTSLFPNESIGIKGLNPKETFLINVKGKPLPVRGWKNMYQHINLSEAPNKGNYLATTDFQLVIKTIKFIANNRPDIKNVVIDDYQYLMSQAFMEKALQGGFEKFNLLAKNSYDVLDAGLNIGNKNFIVLTHLEEENGKTKLKTLGKMLDDKVNPIGLFTYVLSSTVKVKAGGQSEYKFITNTTYDDRGILITAKTPYGCFEELFIPNDLGYVIENIEKYNTGE